MWNAGLDEAQAGIKIAEKSINNLRYADDTTLMAESKEKLKILLMKVKEESEKVMYGCESWDYKEIWDRRIMLLKCGVEEDSWESLGEQGDPTSPS